MKKRNTINEKKKFKRHEEKLRRIIITHFETNEESIILMKNEK